MTPAYVPERGHLVWLDFSPQVGHEQGGRRLALVLSRVEYNRPSGLALFCPTTSRKKGYPFEVPLPKGEDVSAVVLADQVRCLDWQGRRVTAIGPVGEDVLNEVLARVEARLR